jgi:hypothetical protein
MCLTAKVLGSATCDGCEPGKFKVQVVRNGNKTDECHLCPSGYYSAKQNAPFCFECPLGYYADDFVFDKCLSCSRGRHGIITKATNETKGCLDCPKGTYSELEGLATVNECKGCPKGRWSGAVGVKKESLCTNCQGECFFSFFLQNVQLSLFH